MNNFRGKTYHLQTEKQRGTFLQRAVQLPRKPQWYDPNRRPQSEKQRNIYVGGGELFNKVAKGRLKEREIQTYPSVSLMIWKRWMRSRRRRWRNEKGWNMNEDEVKPTSVGDGRLGEWETAVIEGKKKERDTHCISA